MENISERLLKEQRKALAKLFNISYDLSALSYSFHDTGNTTMANMLSGIANEVMEAHDTINKAIGENLSEEVKQAQERSITILKATLAGISLAKKNKEVK